MPASFAWPRRFGATLIADDKTRFRFYAPARQAVTLEFERLPEIAMTRGPDGWFEATAPCGGGTRYRYRLDTGERVPDPASQAQAGDVHGWSVVVDATSFGWRHPAWRGRPWREAIVYEAHCGLMGGFRGVEAALPRLCELGITAVELMPVNAFSGRRNWGYDGVLPYAPDGTYGTPADLKALVDAAHGLGMMLFLDVVYNHFGPDGNYLSLYMPNMFRTDQSTPWGAAIDFREPEVRRYFTENALTWIMEYRVDGLRFDAVHAITEPAWLDEMAAEVRAAIEPGRHVHLVLEHDGNVAEHLRRGFDAQWNDDLHHVLHVMLTGEREGYYGDYADAPAARLAKGLAEGFIYQGEPSAHRQGASRGTPSGDLRPTAFVLFLQNHDQIGNRALGERLTALSEPAALEAAIALQLLAPQIPLIFMGEEEASETPFLFFADYRGDLASAVREGRRREFAHFKAFADLEERRKIPDPIAVATFDASLPTALGTRSRERRALYRRLLALRREEIVPRLEGAAGVGAEPIGPKAVVARWRMGDGTILVIATNLDETSVALEPLRGRLLFEQGAGVSSCVSAGILPEYSTLVVLEDAREP